MADERNRRAQPGAKRRPEQAPQRPAAARSPRKPAAPANAAKGGTPGAVKTWVRRGSYGVILAMVAAIGGGFMALNAVEVPEIERNIKNTSFVCLADVGDGECNASKSVAAISAAGSRRVQVGIDEISPHLINAVIAAEDRSFFEHNGVDAWGIIRAAYRSVAGSASRQGGSTITQQYVKMVYLSNEGTLERKFNEAAIALKIEREMTKPEILEAYLNEAPFGRGAIGIEAAARSYFNKPAADLTITESAYLAGLLRAPSYADEPTNPDKPAENKEAERRRRTVLAGMLEMGFITQQQFDEGDAQPFEGQVLTSAPSSTGVEVMPEFRNVGGEYIIEWVRQILTDENQSAFVGQSRLFGGGLKIYLEVDPTLQYAALLATQEQLQKYPGPAAAMMSIDDQGRVLAMIGGQDYAKSQLILPLGQAGGGSGRQPGSTMKSVALAAYVASGRSVRENRFYSPGTIVPVSQNGKEEPPIRNYEEKDSGAEALTVERATWESSNTVYVQMLQKIGMDAFADMSQKLGIVTKQKREVGAVLGTTDTSLLEMAVAYGTLGNHGERRAPHVIRRIEGASGEVLYDAANDANLTPVQAIEPGVADTVASVLTGSVHTGTGANANLADKKKVAAGKTGTTTDNKDAWFAGFACGVTSVFWMGYPDVDPTINAIPQMIGPDGRPVTGGGFPARMFATFMNVATKDRDDCAIAKVDYGTIIDTVDETYAPTTTTIPPDPALPDPAATTTVVPGQNTESSPQEPVDAGAQAGDATRPGA